MSTPDLVFTMVCNGAPLQVIKWVASTGLASPGRCAFDKHEIASNLGESGKFFLTDDIFWVLVMFLFRPLPLSLSLSLSIYLSIYLSTYLSIGLSKMAIEMVDLPNLKIVIFQFAMFVY